MKDITIIILALNEADVIKDAILSVKDIAKEILVINANSTDNTKEIAEKNGALVISRQFKDFSDQRNFAILHAKTPWIMYLDADERLTDSFKKELKEKIESYDEKGSVGGFYVNRKTFYFGKDWNLTDRVQRVFYKEKFIEWYGVVHETPKIHGEFSEINSPILHFTHRNLSQMVGKTNEWSEYEARLRLKSNHPSMTAWRFIRVMGTEFINSYIKNGGYKNGTYGLIEAIYQAFSMFITYAKLWELQQKKH